MLLGRHALGRSDGSALGAEGSGEHVAEPVSPAVVVRDDVVMDLSHLPGLASAQRRIILANDTLGGAQTVSLVKESGFYALMPSTNNGNRRRINCSFPKGEFWEASGLLTWASIAAGSLFERHRPVGYLSRSRAKPAQAVTLALSPAVTA